MTPVLRLVEHKFRGMEYVELGALTLFRCTPADQPNSPDQFHTGTPFRDSHGIMRAEIGGCYDCSWYIKTFMYIDTLMNLSGSDTHNIAKLQKLTRNPSNKGNGRDRK